MNEDFDDFGNLRSWQEPPPKGVHLDTPPPPPVWPFPSYLGKPYHPPRQRKPAPAYPTKAQDAPF